MSSRLHDLASNALANTATIPPQNITSNTNGVPIDLLTGDGRVNACVALGVVNTLTNVTVQFYESSDNSTYTLISGANTAVASLGVPANSTVWTSFDRTKRYVNCVVTVVGGSAANTGVFFVEGKKQF